MVAVVSGCKKDRTATPNTPEEPRLATITRNGTVWFEFMHDAQNRLTQIRSYSNSGDLSDYWVFRYDTETTGNLMRYEADKSVSRYTTFDMDNEGRITEARNFIAPGFEDIADIYSFQYNSLGRLASREYGDLSSSTPTTRVEYTYDDEGNLTTRVNILRVDQPDEYISRQEDYTPGSMPMPVSWGNDLVLNGLVLLNFDSWLWEVFSAGGQVRSWNTSGELYSDTKIEATDQETNDNGWIIRQTLTRKLLMPSQPDVVTEIEYTYTP